ncbi:MFS transporter [Spirillospora sp. NPDC048911]|uniref:MFS transporter n=1 Tax=Spirillospora sp. NPDC048911 TaxID=3364527 RepID=UPI003723C9B7
MAANTATAGTTTGSGVRGRDFRLLWTAESISKTGSAVTTFALPLVALRTLGANTLMMGVLNAMIWLPWLLGGLQAGAWADRHRLRPLMIGCQLASAILLVSVPILAWLDALTMGYLLAIAFATGCSNVVFTAAYHAFVPFLVGKSDLLAANTRLTGTEQAANIAGPGLGGAITQLSSAVLGLFADAVSFLVAAACLRSIRAREPAPGQDERPDQPRTTIRADIRAAIGFVARDPYLRVITATSASTNLLMAGIQALVVVFLVRDAGLSPWAVGATTITISAGGLLGAVLAPKVAGRLGTARTLLTAPVTDCFLLLFPLAGGGAPLVLALAGTLVWATGIVVRNVTQGAFRQAYCPPGMRGRVAMTMRFITFGVWPLGSLLGGALGTVVDVRTALFLLTAANVVTDILVFIGPMKHGRDLPAEPGAQPGDGSRPVTRK